MAQERARNWYQSIHFYKLVCRKVSVFGPKGTPSREEHKTISSVLTTFYSILFYSILFYSILFNFIMQCPRRSNYGEGT
jgi:hypothetical protein